MRNYTLPRPVWESIDFSSSQIQGAEGINVKLNTDSGSYVATIEYLEWDSRHTDKSVYRISLINSICGEDTSDQSLEDWESSLETPSLIWIKLASEAGDVIRALEEKGYRYTSSLNSYKFMANEAISPVDISIRDGVLEDAERIGTLGSSSFFLDRLYLDPSIDNAVASAMYREWSSNCVKGLCEKVLVAEIDGSVAGFVSLAPDQLFSSADNAKYRRIVLIAVASEHRGKGIGVQLVNASQKATFTDGYQFLLVGTSSINIPAQKLYHKCGFVPHYSEVNLSKRVNREEC